MIIQFSTLANSKISHPFQIYWANFIWNTSFYILTDKKLIKSCIWMTKFYPELIWTIVSAPHIFQTYQNHKAIEINWKHKIKQQQHQLKIEYLQRFHLHCVKVNPNINYSISISSLDTSKFKPTIKSNTPF